MMKRIWSYDVLCSHCVCQFNADLKETGKFLNTNPLISHRNIQQNPINCLYVGKVVFAPKANRPTISIPQLAGNVTGSALEFYDEGVL